MAIPWNTYMISRLVHFIDDVAEEVLHLQLQRKLLFNRHPRTLNN